MTDITPVAAPVDRTLMVEAAGLLDVAVGLRRRIHARPEVGLDLPMTQEAVLCPTTPPTPCRWRVRSSRRCNPW